MAKLKQYYKEVCDKLDALGIPRFDIYSGDTLAEIARAIKTGGRQCAIAVMLEGFKPRNANLPYGIDGVSLSVFFCADYALAAADAVKTHLDYLEEIAQALHGLRFENKTLKPPAEGFRLVEKSGFLTYQFNFNF